MTETTQDVPGKPLTGRKVFLIIATGFSIIVAVNLTLAYQAVHTFPGLEVKNSYVASQSFDRQRAAQLALGWDVSASAENNELHLSIMKEGAPVRAEIVSAVFGRATHVGQDQSPDLRFEGTAYVAPIKLSAGNWNLRLVAMAEDGTEFRQRIIVRVAR